jgi:hypothetical protein
MKTREFRVTSVQLLRLRDDVRSVTNAPVGAHLSDEEFVEYSLDLLPEERVAELDKHLASCEECNEKMIRMLDAAQARSKDRKEVLEAIPAMEAEVKQPDVIAMPRQTDRLGGVGLCGLVAAATDEPHVRWYDAEWKLAGFRESRPDGSVTLFLSSRDHRDGTLVRLWAGTWERIVELKTVPYDSEQVEAKVVIDRDERTALAAAVPLEWEIVQSIPRSK